MSGSYTYHRAVFAASLDPITNGHIWLIKAAAEIFDELWIAIGRNPSKASRYLFDEDQRLSMTKKFFGDYPNILYKKMGSVYLVDFAKTNHIDYIVRGIRNVNDFTVEQTMNNINQQMAPGVQTVFLMPPPSLAEVSSSFVKSLIGYDGWKTEIRKYVPEHVAVALEEKFNEK